MFAAVASTDVNQTTDILLIHFGNRQRSGTGDKYIISFTVSRLPTH